MPLLSALLTTLLSATVFAAQLSAPELKSKAGTSGIVIPIQLSIDQDEAVVGVSFEFIYDSSRLNFKSAAIGPAAASVGKNLSNASPEAGLVKIIIFGLNQEVFTSGNIANLVFDIKANAPIGNATLTLDKVAAANFNGKAVPISKTDGSIFIESTSNLTIPQSPTELVAKGSSTDSIFISLNWKDKSNNEEGFVLERSKFDSAHFTEIKKLPTDTTTYTDLSVSAGKTYFYRLKAFNTAGSSEYSNIASASVTKPPVCANNLCEKGEDAQSCPEDCAPKPRCGDEVCEAGETKESCPEDCRIPPPDIDQCKITVTPKEVEPGEKIKVCWECENHFKNKKRDWIGVFLGKDVIKELKFEYTAGTKRGCKTFKIPERGDFNIKFCEDDSYHCTVGDKIKIKNKNHK